MPPFFIFLFHSSYFYPFTTNVIRALLLKAIKGEAGTIEKEEKTRQQPLEHTSIETTTTITQET
jgi:hypothetical protein